MLSGIAASALLLSHDYPPTRRVGHVDSYHGVTVEDPYRWLEAPISEPEVKSWVDAQNKVTFSYLDTIPNRESMLDELVRRANFERYGIPSQEAGKVFYTRNNGLQAQDVLYVADSQGKNEKVLLDPNTMSDDGTVALVGTDVSLDGQYLLYATSKSGSDWCTWRVRSIRSGKDLPDVVEWSKFGSGFFDKKASGWYYLTFPRPKEGEAFVQANVEPKLMYHKLGTKQSEDKLVFEIKEHPDWYVWPSIDEAREYVYLHVNEPGNPYNRLWGLDLARPEEAYQRLADTADADYFPIHRDGSSHWIQTTKDAPRGKVMLVDTVRKVGPREIVSQRQESLEGVSVVHGTLICRYLKDARAEVRMWTLDGDDKGEVSLPGSGTVSGFSGKSRDKDTYYSYVSMDSPETTFKLDVAQGRSTVFRAPKLPIDTSKYESSLVFYTSKDGTKVPMFLAHRKGLLLDGSNPTILYGYGGFNIPQKPWFSTSRTVWMDMGGVFAVACIRGGGEYGVEWHHAALKTKRQNAYDDFIAAGEHLISQKYCSSGTLAIMGGSNGGLLVGTVMTQRPDLARVALPAVGVMDMLRFNQFTVGKGWEADFGSPENRDEFFALWRISPYHNLRAGTDYPATLVTTADTDDRVVPAHSFKFAAMLQACHKGTAPVMIRVETSAGHGAGKPIRVALAEIADEYAFAMHNMGKAIPQRFGN
ncbi:MAG: prolyl oligopeptidase family protein [Fimbriimonadaceae bacterium]